MQLLSYSAGLGVNFRELAIKDEGKLIEGAYPEINLFNCIFTDAVVSHTKEGIACLTIPTSKDWRVNISDAFFSKEYMLWIGKHTPNIETVLQAHIIKGKLPNIIQDFDDTVQIIRSKIEALSLPDIEFKQDTIITQSDRYDLWMLYRTIKLIGIENLKIYAEGKSLCFADGLASTADNNVQTWLEAHNTQLSEYAVSKDLLCAYLSFGTNMRDPRKFGYTLVSKDGSYERQQVDMHIFTHLAGRGLFPDIAIEDEGPHGAVLLSIEYGHLLSEEYRDLNSVVNINPGHNYALNLVRFI